MPLISIITPSFKSEKTIERTIKSVLCQEFKDYEYIIVDGGSKDSTCEIIKKYELQFEGRMKWNSECDKGIYNAFNKGIERAIGKYIWIVNSDDYMEPTALEMVAKIIAKYDEKDYPVISGAMNFRAEDGRLVDVIKSNPENCKMCFEKDSMGITHPATIVPKAIYDRVGVFYDEFRIIGDIDWFHRAYAVGEKILFIDDLLTNMSNGGVSNLLKYRKSAADRWMFLRRKHKNMIKRYIAFLRWTLYFYRVKWMK